MGENDELLGHLQRLGVPGYEAKCYLALLASSEPLNGYEVAKVSGVPRSTVYETLNKLTRRGIVFEVRDGAGTQTQYVPLAADALVARLRRDFEGEVESLEDGLARISRPSQTHLIHRLDGAQTVLDRAVDLVEQAQRSIHITAWPERLAFLEPMLRDAEARGVEVWVHVWQGGTADLRNVFTNPLTEPGSPLDRTYWLEQRVGTKLLVVVTDQSAMITAGSRDNDLWGIYTDDPATVLLGLEAIVHYIIADTAIAAMGPEEFIKMWESDPVLVRLVTASTRPSHLSADEAEPRLSWPKGVDARSNAGE